MRSNPSKKRGAGPGGSPTIEDCVFGGSWYGSEDGAAIYSEQSWLSVQRCSFTFFHSGLGAIYLDGGTFTDCTFTSNRGPLDEQGFTLRVAGGQASILRCHFRYNFGGCIQVWPGGDLLVGSCLFEDNWGDYGAGVSGQGTITIRNSTFRRNQAGFSGSAVNVFDGALSLDHCLFIANSAYYAAGGTVVVQAGGLNATHCTLSGNRNLAFTISGGVAVAIDHSIIAFGLDGTGGGIHCDATPASMDVTCTDIYGNTGGDWTGCVAGMETTNGNLSANPLFCDVAAGDLSLQADSPCAPANTGDCELIGALGPWCGPLAVEARSWGSIKALYR